MIDPLDDIDPKLVLESFITEHLCQQCGKSDFDVGPLTVGYCCQEVQRSGYTLKHWKNWRACARCLAGPGMFGFEKWISPVISGLVRNGGQGLAETLREILIVQPMVLPRAEIFYMDYIAPGPAGGDMADAVAHVARHTMFGAPVAGAPKVNLTPVPTKMYVLKNRRS